MSTSSRVQVVVAQSTLAFNSGLSSSFAFKCRTISKTFLPGRVGQRVLRHRNSFSFLPGMVDEHIVGHRDSTLLERPVYEFTALQRRLHLDLVNAVRLAQFHVADSLREWET
jgi:hypothetical protein